MRDFFDDKGWNKTLMCVKMQVSKKTIDHKNAYYETLYWIGDGVKLRGCVLLKRKKQKARPFDAPRLQVCVLLKRKKQKARPKGVNLKVR